MKHVDTLISRAGRNGPMWAVWPIFGLSVLPAAARVVGGRSGTDSPETQRPDSLSLAKFWKQLDRIWKISTKNKGFMLPAGYDLANFS